MNEFNPLRDAIPVQELRRVLVIKLRHHGDVLLTSPVFSALKAHAPQAEIDALVYADTAEMLTLHPAIAEVHTIDRQWKKLGLLGQFKAESSLFRRLKSRKYDLIIHLTEHWRGAWICRLLNPRWSVGPAMRNRGKYWKLSFSHLQSAYIPTRHMAETNLDALRRLGIQPGSDARRLILVPGPVAEASVARHLRSLGLQGKDFIHLHPSSRWFFKCWPVDRVASLVQRLQADGHVVVLTAAPTQDELAMLEAIQSSLERPAISLAGMLSLKELAALTQSAKLFIGVDSAPMHIAAAVATPTVALFGPSSDKQWGPWGVSHRVLASDSHPCRPCRADGCGGGKLSDCLSAISIENVLMATNALLIS